MTTFLWILGIVAVILGLALWFFVFVVVPVQAMPSCMSTKQIMADFDQKHQNYLVRQRESQICSDRAHQLRNLNIDIGQARELMKLEKEARVLRNRYERMCRGGEKSPDVEERMREFWEELERMKRRATS